ncbi:LysR family transcriptional regulator [Sphingomonas sp. NSE70-1]|uniref:LysR family transcriptional regulator n=1 Tax=Sphingomonas caseinilyticus TaxID=2908205 RepID=A0ABT0RVJ8_9SPHN|nr:LysR family transcriptional regulator [Sphingomonas caseinilyticus]MCL6699064.1 LysR family transcriptional regulator [Sphingomonas caseinilyticus]
MDRIEAMKVFVATLDKGSLAGAGRLLSRSPAAVSRAIAFLEAHVGVELLHRTTRSLRLSEAGERYAAACRRILTELEEAEILAVGEESAPRGVLTFSAPPISGEDILRPIVDEFLDAYPLVSARLLLLDRAVNLVEEGVDVAMRVAQLPDSSLIATRIGTDVRRVVVASPDYLAAHSPIEQPSDLAQHRIIAFSNFGLDSWSFAPGPRSTVPRSVNFTPRLMVTSVRAALASALEGHGLTRLYSYHVAEAVKAGQLKVVLGNAEFPALPIHLLTPQGRASVPKVRAFLDFAAPRLRSIFSQLAVDSRALG